LEGRDGGKGGVGVVIMCKLTFPFGEAGKTARPKILCKTGGSIANNEERTGSLGERGDKRSQPFEKEFDLQYYEGLLGHGGEKRGRKAGFYVACYKSKKRIKKKAAWAVSDRELVGEPKVDRTTEGRSPGSMINPY